MERNPKLPVSSPPPTSSPTRTNSYGIVNWPTLNCKTGSCTKIDIIQITKITNKTENKTEQIHVTITHLITLQRQNEQ